MDIRSKLRRNGARGRNGQTKKVCPKLERNASLRKVSNILRKCESQRSAEEKAVLASMVDEVREVKNRLHRRQQTIERSREFEDDIHTLRIKCAKLAKAIQGARHLIVYTGAGISTAANIPDYRGPNGIWTLLQQGKQVGKHDLSKAQPTYTHMALREMYRKKILKFIVSQNCDGLHLRSGLPRRALSEVHGNMYVEICSECKPNVQYWRLFDTTEKTSRFFHKTSRICHYCGGSLTDSIVHFGERGIAQWPLNWSGALNHAAKADVILCLGSSLKVLKKYPWLWAMDKPVKKRPDIFIVNLQWTPKDDIAALKINGKCDTVMSIIMENLNIEVGQYDIMLDPIFYHASFLSPRELHTTTQPMLLRASDGTNKEEPISESDDDCPLVLLKKKDSCESDPNKENEEFEPKVNISNGDVEEKLQLNASKEDMFLKKEVKSESNEKLEAIDLRCIKSKIHDNSPMFCVNGYDKVQIDMKTANNKTEKVNILLLSKHSPTKMNGFNHFLINNVNSLNNSPKLLKERLAFEFKPLDTGQKEFNCDILSPINLCTKDMCDDDIENKLEVSILPNKLRLNKNEFLANNINGNSIKSLPINNKLFPTVKPKISTNLRHFRINKNVIANKNDNVIKEKSLRPVPGLIKINGFQRTEPQDLTNFSKRQFNSLSKLKNSNRIIKFQKTDGEVEIHKLSISDSSYLDYVLDLSGKKSDESSEKFLEECQSLARAIIEHTLLMCQAETKLLYSGFHSIIKPIPYLQYDFSLFDAQRFIKYGRELRKESSKTKRSNKSDDEVLEIKRKRKKRKRFFTKKKDPECKYCHKHFNTLYCCFYLPHNSDDRVENKKNNKLVMCDCCGDTESSEDEDGTDNSGTVSAGEKEESNGEENSKSGYDNENNAQPGWFGKGYRKNRRRKR